MTGTGGYGNAAADVCGVLVFMKSAAGAVRTIGKNGENVETGPQMQSRCCIILVGEGQSCVFLGKPSYRLIRHQNI